MSDDENINDAMRLPQDGPRRDTRPRETDKLKPCERCKTQHLKCVYSNENSICQRCEQSGHDCIRPAKKIRFREVPVSKFKAGRKNGTSTTRISRYTELAFVNENGNTSLTQGDPAKTQVNTAETLSQVPTDGHQKNASMSDDQDEQFSEVMYVGCRTLPDTVEASGVLPDTSQRSGAAELAYDNSLSVSQNTFSPTDGRRVLSLTNDALGRTEVFSSDRLSTTSFSSSPCKWEARVTPTQTLDQLVKTPSIAIMNDPQKYLETVLLRYFHEELAPWFDLCDPDCHFATVVLQRARVPGPLRSALLTISARNLCRNKRFESQAGIIQWRGHVLPDLTEAFAVAHHNECIHILSQLSEDPQKLYDETLLAAVVALRTDEELGHDPQDDVADQEPLLRIAGWFMNAQLPPYLTLPHSSPTVFLPAREEETAPSNTASPSTFSETDLGISRLRQACFWAAFRQELHASFLKQHLVRFPLSRCDDFRKLTPATDAVWANRTVTFCADVLEFCYGSESVDGTVAPAYTNQYRWRELRALEQSLCAMLPTNFEPIYCSEPNPMNGKVFPEIWYLNSCHASGTTYIELARMLLNVFDPTRPKLGPGFLAATNVFIQSTKKILFRLRGIALSNHNCLQSLINACLGISMFGEYFDDPLEQEALLGVLSLMSRHYAYLTSQISNALRRAWSSEEILSTPI